MGKKKEYFEEAETKYVKSGWTLRQISEFFGISEQTLVEWKKEGDWEKKRKHYRTLPQARAEQMRELFFTKIEELLQNPATVDAGTIDKLTKIAKILERLEKEAKINFFAQVINVMERFREYLLRNEKSLEFIARFTEHMRVFFDEVKEE